MFLISYYLEIVPSLYGQVVLGGTRQKFLRWNRSLLVVHLLALSNIRKHKKSKRLIRNVLKTLLPHEVYLEVDISMVNSNLSFVVDTHWNHTLIIM